MNYLVTVDPKSLEFVVKRAQEELNPGYYAHFYNLNGSRVIVVFPKKVFRTSSDKLDEAIGYGKSVGIPESQLDIKPLTFAEEEEYYRDWIGL